ncbi:MAG: YqaJ viral recombinase family protein [Rhizobiales bacterium]|nr:YqaJ viral recombinase family protein [Hyphomicrobiales bacterium]
MPIEKHLIESREQWLALRKQDVTASVVGALFGVHPYATALRLYLMHSGIEFDESDNPVLRRGRLMESAVALAVAEKHPEWQIEKNNFYYRDTDLRLGATPDFLIHGDPRGLGVLQTKTAAPSVFERDWGGGDTVPFWIQLQTLSESMLVGAAFGVVGVLQIHAFDLACGINEIARHPGAERKIADAVAKFWDDVANGREPDPDYGKDAALLQAIAPHEVVGKTVNLSGDNELPTLLDQREQIMTALDGYEKRKDEIETQIKFLMRDAEAITGLPDWSITWKTQHRKEFTMPAKDVRTLRIHHRKKDRPDAA